MRVLVADRLPDESVEALTTAGHTVVVDPALTADSLPESLGEAEVLVVRSTKVTSRVFEGAGPLRLVIRAGSGTNTIDCDAATRAGVLVANLPGRNAVAVAELTLGLMLAVDRAIADNVAELRAGHWDKKRFSSMGRGLFGRRLGIVGLGAIGLEVADRAGAFGMELLSVARPSRSEEASARAERLGITMVDSLADLAERVDVLTLHAPMVAETANLVDREVLDALAPGVLINTSRAGLVDSDALLEHLDRGTLTAGLDVFPDEPTEGTAEWASRLAAHPRVVGTHHIGASTAQAQAAIGQGVVDLVVGYARGDELRTVNRLRPSVPPGNGTSR
ncbi:MAG: NAD(P)-dependent oxidoreductase [Nocardioidaceae bacterium]